MDTRRFTDWTAFQVKRAAPTALFPLGQLVATPGALDAIWRNGASAWTYLSRHVTGDWGELSEADKAENELSVREGFRILSAYSLTDGTRIWIITEADRCATTILQPEEY